MNKKPRTGAQELAWEAVDQALWGAASTRPERARRFAATMDARGDGLTRERSLGGHLKRLRSEKGLTPTQAATQTGVAPPRWRNWEANRWIPNDGELLQVARLLGKERVRELWLLRRHAPRVHLARVLDTRPTLQVARSSGEPPARLDAQTLWRLKVQNLDEQIRRGLVRMLWEQGKASDEEALAAELERASRLPGPQQEGWIRQVARRVELDA